jgi:hypothetical protein
MSKASSSKVALWVALGILGLIVLGGIVMAILVFSFMRSDQGQKFGDTIGKLQRLERLAPELVSGMEKYLEANDAFPDEFADLRGTLDGETYKVAGELFTYTKPDDDDPDSAVILHTEDMDMIMGGKVRVEILKDMSAQQVQTMPLQSSGVRVKIEPTTD